MKFRRGGLATVEIRDLARETVYIVQSFRVGRGTRLLADPSVACKSDLTARRTAERLAQSRVGVIAWSRTGDAELRDFDEEPVVFFRAGRIPPELDEEAQLSTDGRLSALIEAGRKAPHSMKTQDPFTTRTDQQYGRTPGRQSGSLPPSSRRVAQLCVMLAVVAIQSLKGFEDETRTRGTPNSYS
jgi:hypothetical protein